MLRDMGVSINEDTPIAGWFIVESPIKMDDLGNPHFRKPPYRLMRRKAIPCLSVYQIQSCAGSSGASITRSFEKLRRAAVVLSAGQIVVALGRAIN